MASTLHSMPSSESACQVDDHTKLPPALCKEELEPVSQPAKNSDNQIKPGQGRIWVFTTNEIALIALQIIATVITAIFGAWAIRSYESANIANDLSKNSLDQTFMANQLAVLALCQTDPFNSSPECLAVHGAIQLPNLMSAVIPFLTIPQGSNPTSSALSPTSSALSPPTSAPPPPPSSTAINSTTSAPPPPPSSTAINPTTVSIHSTSAPSLPPAPSGSPPPQPSAPPPPTTAAPPPSPTSTNSAPPPTLSSTATATNSTTVPTPPTSALPPSSTATDPSISGFPHSGFTTPLPSYTDIKPTTHSTTVTSTSSLTLGGIIGIIVSIVVFITMIGVLIVGRRRARMRSKEPLAHAEP